MSELQKVDVTVAGGYEPEVVSLKRGVPAEVTFTRTSRQGCLDVVHSKELGFEEDLPIDEPKTVTINTEKAGEFEFSCGMDMFHGKVIVK